jgi:hypothetical protein
MEKRIETKADEFLFWIKKEGKISVPALTRALKIDRDLVEQWISMFEAHGTIELVYPANPVMPPYVVMSSGKGESPKKV